MPGEKTNYDRKPCHKCKKVKTANFYCAKCRAEARKGKYKLYV